MEMRVWVPMGTVISHHKYVCKGWARIHPDLALRPTRTPVLQAPHTAGLCWQYGDIGHLNRYCWQEHDEKANQHSWTSKSQHEKGYVPPAPLPSSIYFTIIILAKRSNESLIIIGTIFIPDIWHHCRTEQEKDKLRQILQMVSVTK
jgi:hypothetical protein